MKTRGRCCSVAGGTNLAWQPVLAAKLLADFCNGYIKSVSKAQSHDVCMSVSFSQGENRNRTLQHSAL